MTPTEALDAVIREEKARRGCSEWPHTLAIVQSERGVHVGVSITVPLEEWQGFLESLKQGKE